MARKFPIQKDIINMADFIQPVSIIECNECGVRESLCLEPDQAADFWAINGRWRATYKNVYCPKCAKKKMK